MASSLTSPSLFIARQFKKTTTKKQHGFPESYLFEIKNNMYRAELGDVPSTFSNMICMTNPLYRMAFQAMSDKAIISLNNIQFGKGSKYV